LGLHRAPPTADELGNDGKLCSSEVTVYPSSTRESERHELENETYHYLGWSHSRIERTVDRLLGGEQSDAGVMKSAAREMVAAFGLAGPPEPFWACRLGRCCAEIGFGPKA
jgi:hypothetical protein